MSVAMLVGEDAQVRLDDTRHLCEGIAASPGRTALIGVGTRAVEGSLGAYLVERLLLAADDGTLLDGACYPGLEVAKLYQLLFCESLFG